MISQIPTGEGCATLGRTAGVSLPNRVQAIGSTRPTRGTAETEVMDMAKLVTFQASVTLTLGSWHSQQMAAKERARSRCTTLIKYVALVDAQNETSQTGGLAT